MKKILIILSIFIILFFNSLVIICAIDSETPSGIPYSNMDEYIDEYVQQYIGQTSPGLAVVVFKDNQIIFSKGYGYADIENKISINSTETIFEYGSVSKLFVYTTIMQLVEQGQLDLNVDIRTYLPKGFLKKLSYDEPITLLNIMNHTTGFEDFLFDVVLLNPNSLPDLKETLLKFQPKQVYPPGTVSAYSNYAVALAAYIAQEIIGQDFYEYLMNQIFLPLHMNNTSAHPTLTDYPELITNKAIGYSFLGNNQFKKAKWSYIPLYPAGSINGTAEDLARFAMALLPSNNQVSPLFKNRDTLDQMLSTSHYMGLGIAGFSHGFIERDGYYRGVGHGGNTAYFSSQVNIIPEERFGVVVLSNANNEMELTEGVTKLLFGVAKEDEKNYQGILPDVREVEGIYISARRSHTGFLKVYGYLSLLKVKSLEADKIEMRLGNQSAILNQIAPYTFKKVEFNGSIFKYNFDRVYFNVVDEKVIKVSGDFLPLPKGHTIPWLWFDGISALICIVLFLLTPLGMFVYMLFKRKKQTENILIVQHKSQPYIIFILSGTLLVLNNLILLLRMLINNYRSFSEIKIHILLNYPFTVLSILTSFLFIFYWRKNWLSRKQKILFIIIGFWLCVFIYLLIKWEFFRIIA